MCLNGEFVGVCDSSFHHESPWNDNEAFVVCRQLGYPATGALHERVSAVYN